MDKNSSKQHWENVYKDKSPQEVSWFQNEPVISLKIIQAEDLKEFQEKGI